MTPKAFICGCSGLVLAPQEQEFINQARPWGLILFRRNIESRRQVKALTDAFRSLTGRDDAPVLIDQEGGRVQRMAAPHWPVYPSAARLASLDDAQDARARAIFLAARLIAHDLREVGVTVNCAPVLDTPVAGAHNVIGDRAFGAQSADVARLGRAAADGLLAGAVAPVMKHIPGHGRACADSHLELPVVTASRAELESRDFAPFRANNDLPAAMTAHVVYEALDPHAPCTLSARVVREVVRGWIGFEGLLMSDDLSMKALSGSFRERTEAAFAAGLDIALHCNGDLEEARGVAEAAPTLEGRAQSRAQKLLEAAAAHPPEFDSVEARANLDCMLAATA